MIGVGLALALAAGSTARPPVSHSNLIGLAQAIRRQIQPCYELGNLYDTPGMRIVTTLRLRFNRDGSLEGTPVVVEQSGIDAANYKYAASMAMIAQTAVIRCSPVRLPVELWQGGWDDLNMRFTPGQF